MSIVFTINDLLREAMRTVFGIETDREIKSKLESLLQADVDDIVFE